MLNHNRRITQESILQTIDLGGDYSVWIQMKSSQNTIEVLNGIEWNNRINRI